MTQLDTKSFENLYKRIQESKNGKVKLARNTYIRIGPYFVPTSERNLCDPERIEVIYVRYHNSDIVRLHPNGRIYATDDGWKTYSTKERINYFGPVWQKNFEWYYTNPETGEPGTWRDGEWNRIA